MSRYRAFGVIAFCVLSAGILLAGSRKRQPELSIYGELPALAMTDHNGRAFSKATLGDRVAVVNVVFTRCPTICPMVTLTLKRFEQATRDLGDKLALVSVSADPEFDKPDVLLEFATRFGLDTRRWYFLTGPAEQVKAEITKGLMLAVDERGLDSRGVPDIIHGTHLVLVDEDKKIRGFYDSADANRVKELERDVRHLIEVDGR
jgi:protein SCO1/2